MATPRLFKLKSQVAPAPPGDIAIDSPVARVWVDTGVFHLDTPLDYQVPEKLSAQIKTGIRVQVPFGTREVEGLVIARVQVSDSSAKLKSITKVLSPHPVATTRSLKLITSVAQHWATNPWEIIKSAIPPRVASVDKEFVGSSVLLANSERTPSGKVVFKALPAHRNPHEQVATLALEYARTGSVLIIAPDERDVIALLDGFGSRKSVVLRIDSGVSRAQRYGDYLASFKPGHRVIIGSRNAIFAPLALGATIIVFKETSPEFYEIRNPGWNVRDIALMRHAMEGCNVIFTGYVPSIDIAALIEAKKVHFDNAATKTVVKAFSSADSTLLPGRIFADIRTSVAKGPVLFLVPRKGYANAVLCAHCRNIATCMCGSKLHLTSKSADPSCRICGLQQKDWICTYCGRDRKFLVSRGIERAAEEISRAFPKIPIVLSFGDVIKKSVEPKPSFVLSTPGAAPYVDGGYSAVVILDGLTYFSHDDLRASERAIELFFETAALVRNGGVVLLSIDESHPIVSSLIRWNPAPMLKRELQSRSEIVFPPAVTSAVLTLPTNQASTVATGIKQASDDGRISKEVRVLGPTRVNTETSKIVLLSPLDTRESLTALLHELMRRRSIARKADAMLRIDPYSL